MLIRRIHSYQLHGLQREATRPPDCVPSSALVEGRPNSHVRHDLAFDCPVAHIITCDSQVCLREDRKRFQERRFSKLLANAESVVPNAMQMLRI